MTESVLMAHGGSPVRMLNDLKALGVHLALDDFGTGYSGLSYLKDFPIDALKLDGSFVRGITDDLQGAPIVRAIITQQCSEGQGYYFGQPLPAEQFAEVLATSTRAFINV